jgi:HlyD family secretion protein
MSADTAVNHNPFRAPPDAIARSSVMTARPATLRTLGLIALVALAVLAGVYMLRGTGDGGGYVTAPVTRGPLVRSVIATGTVNPVTTVQVGSYVSGPIQAIYADFNSPVKANQLIAKIDPRPFEVKVAEARAALANARAQLGKDTADENYKKLTFIRNRRLFAADAVSRDTLDSARSSYAQAVAQVALDRANPAAAGER